MGNPVIVDAVRTPLGKRKGWLAGVHPAGLLGFAQARGAAPRRASTPSWSTRWSAAASPRPASSPTTWSAAPGCTPGSPSTPAPRRSTPSAARASSRRTWCTTWSPPAPSTSGSPAASSRCRRIPLGANVPPGHGRPAARRLGDRHAQPVRGRRPDRQATAASPARTSTRSALASQQKARVAVDEGRFKREIAPSTAPVLDAEGKPTGETRVVDADQGLRDTTLEGLAGAQARAPRRPAHRRHVVADLRRRLRRADHGRGQGPRPRPTPRARIVDPLPGRLRPVLPPRRPDRGDPEGCSTAPAWRSPTSTSSRSTRRSPRSSCPGPASTGVDMDKVNVNGGAIALGHPVGSTGTRLITTALHELERRDAVHRADLDVRRRRDGDRHRHRAHLH